jgi:hypothetical protein
VLLKDKFQWRRLVGSKYRRDFVVDGAHGFQEPINHLRCVFGKRCHLVSFQMTMWIGNWTNIARLFDPYLSMKNEWDENVLFVRFQHDVRYGWRWCRQCYFKWIQGSLKVFDSHVDNSPIVVVEQEMLGIKISILQTHLSLEFSVISALEPEKAIYLWIDFRNLNIQKLQGRF